MKRLTEPQEFTTEDENTGGGKGMPFPPVTPVPGQAGLTVSF